MIEHRKAGLAAAVPLLLVLVHLTVLQATGDLGQRLSGADEQLYYAPLRSVVFDGDLDLTNELGRLTPHPEQVDAPIVEATGRPANRHPVGWAIVASVLYVPLAVLDPDSDSATGYEPPYQIAAALSHVLAAAIGLLLAHRLLVRWIEPRAALAALAFVLVGTPLLFYVVYDVHMAHAAGFFAVTAWLERTARLTEVSQASWQDWLLLGLAGGLMMVVRLSNVVFILALLPVVLRRPKGDRERLEGGGRSGTQRLPAIAGLGLALVAAMPFLVAQMAYLHALYGTFFPDLYPGLEFHWTSPALWGGLFSHRHGLFFFSPVLLLAVPGFLLARRHIPGALWTGLGLAILALAWVNTAWEVWWFGHAFGARAWVEASVIFALGIGFLLAHPRSPIRWLAGAFGIVACAWTVALLRLQYTDRLADDGSTTLMEILDALLRG